MLVASQPYNSIVPSVSYLDFNYKILSRVYGSDHYSILIDHTNAQYIGEPSNSNS